ncbi:hypothetical protein BGX38DRAFT_1187578 [Terfezia claveryi]|nr:hypothetical protein BGX38DRAFT_1187578 [Terfezia claveryi]
MTNFISTPTSRSAELLIRVLSMYPTLQPILCYSHRSDIIHLARTCHTLNSILTTSVAPLCKPFPSCTLAVKSCQFCEALVCTGCRKLVQKLEKPLLEISNLKVTKALVVAPYRRNVNAKSKYRFIKRLQKARFRNIRKSGYAQVAQGIEKKTSCASCFKDGQRGSKVHRYPVWAKRVYIPTLEWNDVPTTHTRCTCTRITRSQCVGDSQLVEIEAVPLRSELVGLVKLPQNRRSESEVVCALYIDTHRKTLYDTDLGVPRICPFGYKIAFDGSLYL